MPSTFRKWNWARPAPTPAITPPQKLDNLQKLQRSEVRIIGIITTIFTWEDDELFFTPVLCSPHRTQMFHRGGGGREHRLRTLPRYAFHHHGQCQCKKKIVFLSLSVLSPLTSSIKLVFVCLDSGGDGDHVVGCGFSRDPLRVASGGLAGGFGLHGEELVQSGHFILLSLEH